MNRKQKQVDAATEARQNELLDILIALYKQAKVLPPDLYMKLRKEIEGQLLRLPVTTRQKHIDRFMMVREGLNRGKGFPGAYEYAAERLAGRPQEAGSEQMKKSYQLV